MARKNEITNMVDKSIAIKIHKLRLELGLTRQQICKKVGVSHQQFQKYEKGINRISGGRLFEIAEAMGKPISYFFEGAKKTTQEMPTRHQRMAMEVSRNFLKIKISEYQCVVNDLVRTLAGSN